MPLFKLTANALAGVALAGLAVTGIAALSGVGHRWVDILAQFTAPALQAAVATTAVCLLLRLWPAVWVGAAACLILAVGVWPQWAPTRGTPAATRRRTGCTPW